MAHTKGLFFPQRNINKLVSLKCESTSNIIVDHNQEKLFSDFIKKDQYFSAIKYRLQILKKSDLIDVNESELLAVLDFYKHHGLITRSQKRRLKKEFFYETVISLPPSFLNPSIQTQFFLHCSAADKNNLKKFEVSNRIKLYRLFHNHDTFSIIIEYARIFKGLGLFRSRKNLKNFFIAITDLKEKTVLTSEGYNRIRKFSIRAKPAYTPAKLEYDHFPPDDLYRFAKHDLIRKLAFSKRPIWKIPRTKHRKAISTGRSHSAHEFRMKQRLLFSQGSYAKVIMNYLKKYIDDGILTDANLPLMKNTLKQCVRVKLLSEKELRDCFTLVGSVDIDD